MKFLLLTFLVTTILMDLLIDDDEYRFILLLWVEEECCLFKDFPHRLLRYSIVLKVGDAMPHFFDSVFRRFYA